MLENEPHRQRADLERTRDLMDKATRDALVTGYERLIPLFEPPDMTDMFLPQRLSAAAMSS